MTEIKIDDKTIVAWVDGHVVNIYLKPTGGNLVVVNREDGEGKTKTIRAGECDPDPPKDRDKQCRQTTFHAEHWWLSGSSNHRSKTMMYCEGVG